MFELVPYGRTLLSVLTHKDTDSLPSEEAVGVNGAVLESEAEPVLDTRPIGFASELLASGTEK